MQVIDRKSDHFEDRKDGASPGFVIIHYTETKTLTEAEDYFLGRKAHPDGGRVSTHYMIDYDGTIVRYVDEDKRAWHAGVSYWDGVRDINSNSIGIELVNPGRKYGYRAFTAAQMDALVRLCKDICSRHAISPFRVLGHSDIAPDRPAPGQLKKDPGELFDWPLLADAGIAVWPDPNEADRRAAHDYLRDQNTLRGAFTRVGYNPQAGLTLVIKAFQRHFYPQAFMAQDKGAVGRMDAEAAARLHWLVRNKPHL